MENSMTDKNVNDDFLSQSYSHGIERITGTKDHILNFQVPKEVLEKRKELWNNLFDKYSEMSDDIELNLKTLEPEEKEEEELSEGKHSCGQRIPMHKPAILVQYWINTGNTPYKLFLDKKELSESGSSLSEEEIISPSYSLLSNMVNESNHKHEDDTSFSSVDTAAYILSNANITKKADTIAIIEGAKSNGVKSSRDNYTEAVKTVCNDRTNCTETMATDHLVHNENSNDILHNSSSIKNVASDTNSDTNNHLVTSTVISANTIQPNVSSQNSLCDTIDKADVPTASQKNVDLRSIDDIVNIFQQFNEVSKRLSIDDKSNSTLSERKTLKRKHNSSEKQISVNITEENIKDASLVSFHRKKLYTGRNSPVDLILIEKEKDSSDMNKPKSPNILSLHPALDPDNSNRSESLLYKDKSKRYLSSKKIHSSRKFQVKKRQKRSSVSNKNIISDEIVVANNSISDSNIDCSLQNLSSSNNTNKRSSNSLIKDYNDINVSMENIEKKPIVYLEKATFFKGKTSKSVKNKDITQENSTDNNTVVSGLCIYEDLESADSDQSTILICECNNNVSQDSSSNSSFHLRLSTEDDCSVMNTKKGNDKLTNLKNCSYMDQNKKPFIILERLSQSIIERYKKPTQVLSINNNTGKSQKLLNKSKINSFNSNGTNIKNGVKLREIKVILDRLRADTYLKRSSNATSISCSAVKDNISQDTIVSNKKRKFKNTIRNSNDENKRITRAIHKINNNYSLRIHARSQINDDEMNNTANDVVQHDNRVSDETESNSTSQYRNHDGQVRASQDKRRKFSILDLISSDEDDFVRLIRPKKKFKTLIDNTSKTHVAENNLHDEATLVSANEDKYNSNRNMNSKIYSSKQGDLKKINTLIRGRDRRNKVKLKSSDSNVMSVYSFPMYKYKKFSPFPRRSNQCDSIMRNSNGRSKKYRFSNIKDISNTSEKHLNKATKKNGINCGDATCVTLFQTKAFNTESSDSDNRSNNNITLTRKSLRVASTLDRTRFNDYANKKELRNASHVKMHVNKQSNLLNSPIKRHEATDKIYNVKKRLRSASGTTAETNKIDKEFNINLRTTTRSMPGLSVTSNMRNAFIRKRNTILNGSLRNNSPMLLRNKQIPEKLDLKNLQANQQRHVRSPVKKLVTFQTKSYYDSDSSGCL